MKTIYWRILAPVVQKVWMALSTGLLTIIIRVRMGSESIAHEAEGLTANWLRGHEGERNNKVKSN